MNRKSLLRAVLDSRLNEFIRAGVIQNLITKGFVIRFLLATKIFVFGLHPPDWSVRNPKKL